MRKSMPTSQFRDNLSEVLEAVETNDGVVTITRAARPIAVVMSAREYERLMDAFDLLYQPMERDEEYSALDAPYLS